MESHDITGLRRVTGVRVGVHGQVGDIEIETPSIIRLLIVESATGINRFSRTNNI
jgi:hypothetical protein